MPSKNRTNKRKVRKSLKTRRRKQRGGDDPILPEDILFQDGDVCILKPGVKKGILIFTNYKQPADMPSLCEAGLKSGRQLQKEGVNFGRTMIHDYIFFRAPYFFQPIDYTSIDTEIESSFGNTASAESSRVWIRIDPEKSYVYSSEIRAKFFPKSAYGVPQYLLEIENEVRKSRKSMIEYLRIIDLNKSEIEQRTPGERLLYNLFTSKVLRLPIMDTGRIQKSRRFEENSHGYNDYPLNSNAIHKNSEVLVRVPHLTPNFFVKCT